MLKKSAVNCKGCCRGFIFYVLVQNLHFVSVQNAVGANMKSYYPFSYDVINKWIVNAKLFCEKFGTLNEFGSSVVYCENDTSTYWGNSIQFLTWWKNNVERKGKFIDYIYESLGYYEFSDSPNISGTEFKDASNILYARVIVALILCIRVQLKQLNNVVSNLFEMCTSFVREIENSYGRAGKRSNFSVLLLSCAMHKELFVKRYLMHIPQKYLDFLDFLQGLKVIVTQSDRQSIVSVSAFPGFQSYCGSACMTLHCGYFNSDMESFLDGCFLAHYITPSVAFPVAFSSLRCAISPPFKWNESYPVREEYEEYEGAEKVYLSDVTVVHTTDSRMISSSSSPYNTMPVFKHDSPPSSWLNSCDGNQASCTDKKGYSWGLPRFKEMFESDSSDLASARKRFLDALEFGADEMIQIESNLKRLYEKDKAYNEEVVFKAIKKRGCDQLASYSDDSDDMRGK